MKKIIDGKLYDTETATEICELACTAYRTDFAWHNTSLYVTKKGAYFLAGEGGARSMWAQDAYGGGRGGGSGIRPIDADEAKRIAGRHVSLEIYEKFFGAPEEA